MFHLFSNGTKTRRYSTTIVSRIWLIMSLGRYKKTGGGKLTGLNQLLIYVDS